MVFLWHITITGFLYCKRPREGTTENVIVCQAIRAWKESKALLFQGVHPKAVFRNRSELVIWFPRNRWLLLPGLAACAESDVNIPWHQSAIGNYLEQASRVGELQPCGPGMIDLVCGEETTLVVQWSVTRGMHRPNGMPAGRLWRDRQSGQLEKLPGFGMGTSSHQAGVCLCSGLSDLCTGDVNM